MDKTFMKRTCLRYILAVETAEDYKTLFHNHKIKKNMILEVESLSVAFELFTLPHPSKTT